MSKARLMWVNGELLPVGGSALDPLDRGFTLGDGLFETMRVKGIPSSGSNVISFVCESARLYWGCPLSRRTKI